MAQPVHPMIRVFDEAKSLDFCAPAFGLEVAERRNHRAFLKQVAPQSTVEDVAS